MVKLFKVIAVILIIVGILIMLHSIFLLVIHKEMTNQAYSYTISQGFSVAKEAIDKGIVKNQLIAFTVGVYLLVSGIFSLKFNRKAWVSLLVLFSIGFLYGSITLIHSILLQQVMSPGYRIIVMALSLIMLYTLIANKELIK